MRFFKAYVVGMFFPGILVPFIYLIPRYFGYGPFVNHPFQILALSIPVIWGLWNTITVFIGEHFPEKSWAFKSKVFGLVLGLIAGIISVTVFPVFKYIFNFEGYLNYSSLIILPIVYAFLWRFVVDNLNSTFDIY